MDMSYLFEKMKPFALYGALAFLAFSCSNDDEGTLNDGQDQKVDQTEIKTVLETDQMTSAADTVIQDLFTNRQSGKSAKDNSCYEAEYTNTGFTVAFDQCKVEDDGEVLSGSLTVTYGGQDDSYTYSVSYDNLIVGDIELDGTRSISLDAGEENSIIFNVVSDMSLTLADDSVISEKGNKISTIILGEEFGTGKLTVDGEWIVKADGNTYSVNIKSDLEAEFGCDYVGKGLMELTKNGLTVDVDFGNGECDDIGELTYPDGTKETISLKD
ncbi:hypothetical protein B4Q04_08775 [Zobellia sp. OII3]|nr:hypothetical protein B4Q04_08775 [Zobellia sp. OII3]